MNCTLASGEFLAHCRYEKNLAEKTLKAYSTDLKQLLTFLEIRHGITKPETITKQELKDYLASMETLKPKSVRRKIATAKAFLNYLEFEDRIVVNPFRKMRIRFREEKKLPAVMDIKEIRLILEKAYSEKKTQDGATPFRQLEQLRNCVILELLFATGARVSEIAGLTADQCRAQKSAILIKGKGRKERWIHIFHKETSALLQQYVNVAEQHIKKAGGYLLVNRLGRPLSEQSIRGIVKKAAETAGIRRRITPHVFRHSFATLLLERNVDIRSIQSLLGHSSISITQIYTHVSKARERHILRTKHPRREIRLLDRE